MFLRDFIEENHSRQDGFRIPNFLVFHTPPCGNLQTKANTFCIIRTSFKDGAYYCYCAYVLRISRYSDFLSPMLTNTGIFLRGLKLSGESRS